uniref:ATP-grasp domain-containing protein n=1 Tax=viral metagenome TaxID=1070528 RepID=A0A6C0LDU4_9ZZZZ
MKRNLIFYGYHEKWADSNLYNKNTYMNHLSDIIHDVKIFTDISSLQAYLKTEGQNYKNYILPSLTDHIRELNNAEINSLFEIDSFWLDQLDYKKKFAEYAIKNKLSQYIPRIYSKEDDRSSNILTIVKPNIGAYSYQVYKKRLGEVQDWEFTENVVQEYIKDPIEYAGYFVAYNGNITHSFAYMGDHGNGEYIKCEGGIFDASPKIRVTLNKKIVHELELFLKPTLFTGICCFDFKIKDRNLKVFEINPRLGGSLTLEENAKDLTDIVRKLIEIYDDRNVYN